MNPQDLAAVPKDVNLAWIAGAGFVVLCSFCLLLVKHVLGKQSETNDKLVEGQKEMTSAIVIGQKEMTQAITQGQEKAVAAISAGFEKVATIVMEALIKNQRP